jgi:hypothetical protein
VEEFAKAGIVKGIQYYRSKCKSCYYIQKKKELKKSIEEFRNGKPNRNVVVVDIQRKITLSS